MSEIESQESERVQEYAVRRDDEADLEFSGVKIASEDTRWSAGRESTRWEEYRLYRTIAGIYVLAHAYRTQWQGEENHYEAWTGPDPKALILGACYDDDAGETILPRAVKALAEAAGIDIAEHID